MTRNAVFGTEVSMDCEVVKLESRSMRGAKLSTGNRTTSGPRL